MGHVIVRRASPKDVDAAVRLFVRLDEIEHDWRIFPPRTGTYDVTDRYVRIVTSSEGVLVVAESKNRMVGLAVGEIRTPSSWSDERSLDVMNVYVEPDFRGRGIGRALVAEVVGFARGHNLQRLTLRVFAPNESAVAFWSSLGFSPRLTQFVADAEAVESLLKQQLKQHPRVVG